MASIVTAINFPNLIQKSNRLISVRLGLVRKLRNLNFPQNVGSKLVRKTHMHTEWWGKKLP